jgi:superfamily I DNA/RNA helicase
MLDRFYRKRYKILGGPGCGKTTKILEILSEYLKGGMNPDQVLMIGFAKATIQTLQERCLNKKLLDKEQVESITTIHKFCLDRIGKVNILNSSAKKEFRKKFTTDPSSWFMLDDPKYDTKDEDPAVWTEKEDKKLAVYYDVLNKAQHNYGSIYGAFCTKKGLKDEGRKVLNYFRESLNDKYKYVHTDQLIYFYNELVRFKDANGFVDFDDMLLRALQPTIDFPSYKLVLVDEVQDLSRLEWQVISKIGRKTEELFLVGDDDQAIYGWKGSDVSIFQKWPCQKQNVIRLEKSHRLPGKIYDLAINIRSNIKTRLGNEFSCAKRIDPKIMDEGSINEIVDLQELDKVIKHDSDVIFCSRAKKNCREYASYLKEKGFVFLEKSQTVDDRGKFKPSFPEKCQDIIAFWNSLRDGHSIPGTGYRKMVEFIKPEFIKDRKKTALFKKDTTFPELLTDEPFTYEQLTGKYFLNAPLDKIWHEIFYFDTTRKRDPKKPNALFRDNDDFNDYLYRCWEQNNTLKTKIILSSIHGVKGMEADKVVMNVEWGYSLKAYEMGSEKEEDEEVRVCYVGITRCKKDLYLFQLPGERTNPFPLLKFI